MEPHDIGKKHECFPNLVIGVDVVAVVCFCQTVRFGTKVTSRQAFDLNVDTGLVESW